MVKFNVYGCSLIPDLRLLFGYKGRVLENNKILTAIINGH